MTPAQNEYIEIRRQALATLPRANRTYYDTANFDATCRQLLPPNPTHQDWLTVARKVLQVAESYASYSSKSVPGEEQ